MGITQYVVSVGGAENGLFKSHGRFLAVVFSIIPIFIDGKNSDSSVCSRESPKIYTVLLIIAPPLTVFILSCITLSSYVGWKLQYRKLSTIWGKILSQIIFRLLLCSIVLGVTFIYGNSLACLLAGPAPKTNDANASKYIELLKKSRNSSKHYGWWCILVPLAFYLILPIVLEICAKNREFNQIIKFCRRKKFETFDNNINSELSSLIRHRVEANLNLAIEELKLAGEIENKSIRTTLKNFSVDVAKIEIEFLYNKRFIE